MVVPVPCAFDAALKLLTSTLPATSRPQFWLTTAIPYGFTSPLDGTVDPSVVMWVSPAMNGPDAAAAIWPATRPAAGIATMARRPRMCLPLTVGSPWTPGGGPWTALGSATQQYAGRLRQAGRVRLARLNSGHDLHRHRDLRRPEVQVLYRGVPCGLHPRGRRGPDGLHRPR